YARRPRAQEHAAFRGRGGAGAQARFGGALRPRLSAARRAAGGGGRGVSARTLDVAGHAVELAEAGSGAPLLYLHGFADLHGASLELLPFHLELAKSFRVIAPAHPGCAGSAEDDDIETIDDLAFRMIETIDALGLDRVDLAGACVGGWLAAEVAVRPPERVRRLALVGASGLFVPGEPIGDLFWETQPRDGTDYSG